MLRYRSEKSLEVGLLQLTKTKNNNFFFYKR